MKSSSSGSSLPGPAQSRHGNRSVLVKAIRRYFWSGSNRCRALYRRSPRITQALVAVVLFAIMGALLLRTSRHIRYLVNSQKTEDKFSFSREDMHFKRLAHLYMPRQSSLLKSDLTPCAWVYLEVNAYDGREIDGFFTDGNGIFEEANRAEQSVSRAFCAYAFESDPNFAHSLLAVRSSTGLFTERFNVFPGISVGSADDTSSVTLSQLLTKVTVPLEHSVLSKRADMASTYANGHNGSVVVRISGSLPELYAHVDALFNSRILCHRVDRLILNVTESVRDISVSLPYSPSAEKFHAALGVRGLGTLAKDLESQSSCRTRLFVTDEEGSLVVPIPLGKEAVFYAVLAGAPTFDERIAAQTATWMHAVPSNRITIYTNVERAPEQLQAARGRRVVVVEPHEPDLEKHLTWMQSWSHLVRVRETWDRYMKDDPSIKWLALVDDDTFVFPAGLREYLTMIDSRNPVWGGSGEQARIDNGDHGQFAYWLRNLSVANGAPHCYLSTEDVPNHLRGSHNEHVVSKTMNGRTVSKKVSHMCHDTFCKRGCPSVPQGAAIVLSRDLVKRLRPSVEECEALTSTLCDRCGSQRLYMCVNQFTRDARTLLTRGICRASWKLEHRENFPIALTFHAFLRNHRLSSMTGSMYGDMAQLWRIGEQYEGRGPWQGTVPMSEIADALGCNNEGHFNHSSKSCDPFPLDKVYAP